MRKLQLLFLLLLYSFNNAQSLQAAQPIDLKSPQSYAFEKYGNVPVNLYTGSIDMKIPVASIGDKGHDISATLIYDSSGFIPHKKSDAAGVNWSLIAGGRITRQLNTIPDEYVGNPTTQGGNPSDSGKDLHGFLKGVRLNSSTNENAYKLYGGTGNTDTTGAYWWMGPVENGYEGTPDIFNFNAMGLSGKFIIGNNGKVLVESNDPNIRVDISQMETYPGRGICVPPASKITIFDGKGNQYIFGGNLSTYEISYSYDKLTIPAIEFGGYPMINSFSLSKIIFSDGKEVEFNYEQGSLSDGFCKYLRLPDANNNSLLLSIDSYFQDGTRVDEWKNCVGGMLGCAHALSEAISNSMKQVILKKSILRSIKYLDNEIKINYKNNGYPIKQDNENTTYLNEWVINDVKTYHKNILIKEIQFSYDQLGGEFKRPFLKTIQNIKSRDKYSFDYYKTENLPAYYTKGIDHWGYWNGRDNNNSLAPFDTYNASTGDYTLNNTFRDTDSQKYDVALLSKITYPTKGYTTFLYEPQYYGKRIERTSSSQFLPTLTGNSGLAGGARINKISDYLENGILSSEKEYKYTTSLNSSVSSGILMNWPRYMYYIEMYEGSMLQKFMIRSSSNVQQNSMDSYNIGYSKVFEITTNKGYVENNFTTYESHPDLIDPDASNIRQYKKDYTNFVPVNLYKNFRNLYGVDKSILRGKPLNQKIFSQSNLLDPIKVIDYDYYDNMEYNPNNTKDNNNYVSINHLSGYWVQGYRKFMNSAPLKKITTTEYLLGGNLTTYNEFLYASEKHLNLSTKKTLSSDNNEFKTIYQYSQDVRHGSLPQQNIPPYQSTPYMENKNMIGIPLITSIYKNDILQNRTQITYDYDPSTLLVLPKKEIVYYEDQTITTPNNGQGSATVPNPIYGITNIIYDQYDAKGDIILYTLKSGSQVAVAWGYNKTLPIVKIEGKDAGLFLTMFDADLTSLSTSSNNDIDLNSKELFKNKLDLFQKRQFNLDVQITTYTHNPLIGITSITPPNGVTEYYFYDAANRLEFIKIKDEAGNFNIVKEYQYNRTYFYNDEISRSFTRNNCPPGTLPGSVIYTVPANTYSSTISPEDAKQKAENDINANV